MDPVSVALYIRVSTAEQAMHGLSLQAQAECLESWAKAQGLRVAGLYADEGISARKPASRRPALQRLLDDVRSGKVDLIVFTKLDRWFRNVGEYYKVQEVLEAHNVNWRTVLEDYDTSTASGRLKINIMLSVAQDEADRTSERIRVVFDAKRARGEAVGCKVPPGLAVREKRHVIDEESQEAVSAFFRRYLASGSTNQTRRWIGQEYGLALSYRVANAMLHNPLYIDRYITREEFDRIQESLRHHVRQRKGTHTYLFTGLIVCGECGAHMAGTTTNHPGTLVYRCPERYRGDKCRNSSSIVERKIEAHLLESAAAALSRARSEAVAEHERRAGADRSAEIARVTAKLGRLKELFLDGLIPLDEYKERRAAAEQDLARLTAVQKPPDFSNVAAMLTEGWRDDYLDLPPVERRAFWRLLLREIRFYPDRRLEFDFLST